MSQAKKPTRHRRKTVPAADRRVSRAHNMPPTNAPPASPPDDDEVLTFAQWCKLNSIGERTGRRLLASGRGPRVLQLTESRIGIRRSDNRLWQDSLARA
jgi:hypothetical protein